MKIVPLQRQNNGVSPVYERGLPATKQALYNLGSDKSAVDLLRATSASRICAQHDNQTIIKNSYNHNDCSTCVSQANCEALMSAEKQLQFSE
jgi:hypothetical protein